MSPLLTEVISRWQQMFAALVAGDDLPPGQRLRTEGLMEAVILLGELTPDKLQQQMDKAYREAFGRSLSEEYGGQWQDFYLFPQIPAMARRAPVYPSTTE